MARPSVLIVGKQTRGKYLKSIGEWKRDEYPNVSFAQNKSEVLDGRLATSDVIIFYGHGYPTEDWSFGGDDAPIFRWSWYTGRFDAALIVFATCFASKLVPDALDRMNDGHVAFTSGQHDEKALLPEYQSVLQLFLSAISCDIEDRSEISQLWADNLVIARRQKYGVEYERYLKIDIEPGVFPRPNLRSPD